MKFKDLIIDTVYRGKPGAGILFTYILLVIFGFLLGYFYNKLFTPVLIIPTIVATASALGATNILDDYFDFAHGIDKEGNINTFTRTHPIFGLKLSEKQTFLLGISLAVCAVLIAVLIYVFFGRVLIFIFALLGFVVIFEYAGPPLKYRYHYLGEMGPLLAGMLVLEGAYYVDTGFISIDVLLVSIPFSIIKALLAFLGNSRDIETDRVARIRTISMLLGIKRSVKTYISLFSLSYLILLFLIIFNLIPIYSLSIYLTLPLFILHAKNFSMKGIPPDAEKFAGAISTYILLLSVLSLILYWVMISVVRVNIHI